MSRQKGDTEERGTRRSVYAAFTANLLIAVYQVRRRPDLGQNIALMTAEINVVDGLDTDKIEDLLEDITRKVRSDVPEITQTSIELHPESKTGNPAQTG